jgi:CDP-4-dehydro-6-deoxyglucose reductase, E3
MHTVSLSSGKTFKASEAFSLIESAEQAGIILPYSCKNGLCSSCKCKVIGPTKIIFDELGLSDQEREDGWKLACSRSAMGDVLLDIEEFKNLKLPTPKVFPAKIDRIDFLSKDIIKLILRLPPGKKFDFVEGQYIDLIGPKGVTRSYSLARQCDGMNLELHIRRVIGGQMSDYLFNNAKVDDLLRINGPRGTFILQSGPDTDIIFLATGTGIAPVKSMLEQIENMPKELKPNSVKVFWGMRYPQDLYWNPHNKFDNLNFIPVLSQANKMWTGAHGYVQDVMIKNMKNIENVQVYACGSDAMIRTSKSQLLNIGFNEVNFFSDAFVVSGVKRSGA